MGRVSGIPLLLCTVILVCCRSPSGNAMWCRPPQRSCPAAVEAVGASHIDTEVGHRDQRRDHPLPKWNATDDPLVGSYRAPRSGEVFHLRANGIFTHVNAEGEALYRGTWTRIAGAIRFDWWHHDGSFNRPGLDDTYWALESSRGLLFYTGPENWERTYLRIGAEED